MSDDDSDIFRCGKCDIILGDNQLYGCMDCPFDTSNVYCKDCSYTVVSTTESDFRRQDQKCLKCLNELAELNDDMIYGLNVKQMSKYLETHLAPLKQENDRLKAENHLLKMQLKYQPGGEGAKEAKIHFQSLVDKN